ncbi:hypothetical protein EW145_g1627 [Phellinidium pouzarii]|uniref:DUF7330 domain-containing protein n=1 Tax=Phellinidium pouzarii TaxID=167371 RepID=A0A4S4LDS7_9AGAM|nr:hypothetical protein EW145_g1627 [Phellinidium pouzarii]
MIAKPSNSSACSLQEDALVGNHKVSYRPGKEWDFKGCTENAPIDVSLAMPPHRPRLQPENHRTGMFLSSGTGTIHVKVCRHALNRSFHLAVSGRTSDITVWVPSNFSGFITCAGARASFSAAFVDRVLVNAQVNRTVPRAWTGDEINIATGGNVVFRVWDVFARAPESECAQKRAGDVWRRVFKGVVGEKGVNNCTVDTLAWNWDFLIEDEE